MNAQVKDRMATAGFYLGSGLVVLLLFSLLGYIILHGYKAIDFAFLFGEPEALRAGGGIGPNIFNSFYLLFLSMALTAPLGILGGIYLVEYARQNFFTNLIRLSIETLTSLPSIVVGLFGLLIFVTIFGFGYSLIAGALALTVINLPLMVRVTEENLRTVPRELREASLSLGATRWHTVCRVVLPCALPGLVTGVIITAGRVFGEAAALLFTAGMTTPHLNFGQLDLLHPTSPWNPFRPGETLAVHIWKINSEALIPDIRRVADGSAAVLVLVVLAFNLLARWMARRLSRRLAGR
ncbi:MAG TPA: phosphate ABC transporter permease PstA [Desulfotomaculum sp.]|nr:phosphate ABC transporter permease PstA [Desulfotomaculum sp.]